MISPCHDCDFDTQTGTSEPSEWYMVTDAIWRQAGNLRGFLCIGCLEARLGRCLVAADFEDTPINNPDKTCEGMWPEASPHSARLLSRLEGVQITPRWRDLPYWKSRHAA